MRAQVVLKFLRSSELRSASAALFAAVIALALPAAATPADATPAPSGSGASASDAQEDPDAAPEGEGDKAPAKAAPKKTPTEKQAAAEEVAEEADDAAAGNPALVGLVSSSEAGAAFPLHIQASLTNQVGQGTFVIGPTHNSSVVSSLSIAPRFQWGAFNVMLRQNINFEWTSPDNATGRRMDWFDTSIDANYIIPVGATGLLIGLRGGVRLPFSLQSRNQGRLIGLTSRLNLIYSSPIPGLTFIGGLGGQVNANIPAWRGAGFLGNQGGIGKSYTDSLGKEQVARTCLVRTGELANDACASVGSIGSLSGVGIMSYTLGDFNFAAVLSAFTIISEYWSPDDEFTSEYANPGINHFPLTNGDLSVTWSPLSWFALTGGLTSFQPMFDAKNQFPRFPFWDFIAVRDNYSSFYVSTTFSY